MVRFEDVTYRYDPAAGPALEGLNLHLKWGERVCLMGPNGSGKSTFARVLAGLLTVQAGTITVPRDPDHPIPVGMLFQNPDNSMVAVTVEKEIAFALENLSTPPAEMVRRVEATLARFRIEHLRRRLTAELSGGEKQRVALASVMVCEPPVVVLDEPDSYLDRAGREILREELLRLRQARPGLIEVRITQYPSVAREYPRLLVFHEGRVLADGAPEEILADRELVSRAALVFEAGAVPRVEVPVAPEDVVSRKEIRSVRLEEVTFDYGGARPVLERVDAWLRRGETVGVVGPSGAGKSTLGSLVCGLLKPDSGRIVYLNGSEETVPSGHVMGQVSALFQQPERQFFLPTCAEEVAFGPANLGRPADDGLIDRFLEMVGLPPERFRGRDPFTLSGGEKRRLAFAAVLSMRPGFVVFDEPTCGLDQEGVGRFVGLGRALRRMNTGLVVISHDGDVLRALVDRVLYLVGDGSWEEAKAEALAENGRFAGVISPPKEAG